MDRSKLSDLIERLEGDLREQADLRPGSGPVGHEQCAQSQYPRIAVEGDEV